MQVKTSITNDAESYRRGVIFGLTMAEVLLLLVFCILLFLAIINDRLKEKMRELAALEYKFQTKLAANQSLTDQNNFLTEQMGILAGKISTMPETKTNTEFSEKMFETAVVLEALDPEKASEILYALNENPTLFQDVQLSTIDEWDELTTEAQYSVTEEEFTILSQLNAEEKKNFLANAEIASQNTPNELQAMKQQAESLQAMPEEVAEVSLNDGNNWPPIISLSEAKDYSFNVGSANLAPKFKKALRGSIADQIYEILNEYDADVIEVIGHTDPQPMNRNRTTNLDDFSVEFFTSDRSINLNAKDNAGLGYARALSVTKELMQVPKLGSYTILPYSAGQMITPDEQLQNGSTFYESSQLRRIEIRVRRKQ